MLRFNYYIYGALGILFLEIWIGAYGQIRAANGSAKTAMGYRLAEESQPGPPQEVERQLTSFLRAHPQSAEEYIIGQFKNHDVVFLGEGRQHGTRERLLFLQRLIPLLYKAGVYHVGFEMATSEDQPAIDRLLSAPKYDEEAAFTFLQHWDFGWALQEYADVFRVTWEVNHRLPAGAPKLRILGIDVKPDYRRLKPGMDPDSAEARGLIVGGNRDAARDNRMADVLRREVLRKGFKGLMYNGMGHSQPKFKQLKNGVMRIRFAQLIYAEIGERVTSVNLESPRRAGSDLILDAVMAALPSGAETLGFNASASPVDRLLISTSSTAQSTVPAVKLDDFYDGYVFLSLRSRWAPATFNPKYVTDERVKRAKAEGLLPNLPTVTAESVRKRIVGGILGNVQASIDREGGY